MKRNKECMEIIRATKTAEQAGAYYVRIQAMARKHKIPLNLEFDEHDTPVTKDCRGNIHLFIEWRKH